MSAPAANLVYIPFDLLRSCVFNSIDNDMPLLASIFGSSKSKPSTPKPAGKRRASPLKDSPVASDDDDESSDYVMAEINDEKKSKSDLPKEEDIQMEQADYDRDSDTDEDNKPAGRPLKERPRQRATPMQPPVPPLKLTPKVKAQPSVTLDDETESDNAKHPNADRPPSPRRPTIKAPPASIDHSKWTNYDTPGQVGIMLLKEATNPSPFWNSKFLSFVQQYYHESCTIQQKHPDFDYVNHSFRGRPRREGLYGLHQEELQHVALSMTIPRISVPRSFQRYPAMGRLRNGLILCKANCPFHPTADSSTSSIRPKVSCISS